MVYYVLADYYMDEVFTESLGRLELHVPFLISRRHLIANAFINNKERPKGKPIIVWMGK